METNPSSQQPYKLDFHGKGSDFFSIIIVNWLLTVITLGFYYPWAKAKQLRYLYSATSFHNDRFQFSGTGKEMFIGYIKTILIMIILATLYGLTAVLINPIAGIVVLYLLLFMLIPLMIHGSFRYRMSRTSWRGIRFGYRGNKWDFFGMYLKWIFLTLITLGFYAAWMDINYRRYVIGNIKAGDASFQYKGNGLDYFLLNLKGYLLSVITLGIYSFWWQKDLFAYLYDNLSVRREETELRFKSAATGGGFFKLSIVNILILIFTLGLGYAWVVVRTMKFTTDNILTEGDLDADKLNQTQENYTNALGDEMTDFFDIDLTF